MDWIKILTEVGTILSALAAIMAAWHARKGNQKSTVISANVNGTLAKLVSILSNAAIEIPHNVATKVVATAEQDGSQNMEDLTPEEKVIIEWLRKLGTGKSET